MGFGRVGGRRGVAAPQARRRRAAWLVVEALDLRLRCAASDQVALRLLRDVARGLILDLIEGREGLHPLLLDLDDVPAELALDRLGNLARLELERGVGEFRHHPVLGEPAEIAALAARILGQFGGDLGEILAVLDPRERRLGLVLGRQQDVAGVDLRLRRLGLGRLVIGLVLGLVGRAALATCRSAAPPSRACRGNRRGWRAKSAVCVELVGIGLLGDELEVDEIVEHIFLALGALELLGQARADVGHRVVDVVLGDRRRRRSWRALWGRPGRR